MKLTSRLKEVISFLEREMKVKAIVDLSKGEASYTYGKGCVVYFEARPEEQKDGH